MPTLQSRTREQIRVHVGQLLGAVKEIEADAAGSTTTLLTDDLFGTADDYNGWWLVFTSQANNDGQIRRVTDVSVAANRITLTFAPAVTTATADADTAELWAPEYDPVAVHNAINQAILDATGAIFDPEEDVSLHADGVTTRFDIPNTFEALSEIYYRNKVQEIVVHACDTLFDETTNTNFTQTNETEDVKRGSASLEIVVAAAAVAGDFVTDSIGALDLSDCTHIEGWIKSTVALSASDYVIHLDNGVVQADGTDRESLNVPAASALIWTYLRVGLVNPALDSAIISIGFEMNVDRGAHTVWFDDIKAVRGGGGGDGDSAEWVLLPNHLWTIDKSARDLVLLYAAEEALGYKLLKLVGGDNPVLLEADATVTEIPENYITHYAAGMLLGRHLRGEDPALAQVRQGLASRELSLARQARLNFPMLKNHRFVT